MESDERQRFIDKELRNKSTYLCLKWDEVKELLRYHPRREMWIACIKSDLLELKK